MNREQTAELLVVLKSAWPRTTIPDPDGMLQAYQIGLKDVDPADAALAVERCIRDCVFLPVVAEIRQRLPERGIDIALHTDYERLHNQLRDGDALTASESEQWHYLRRRLGLSSDRDQSSNALPGRGA